MSRPYYDGISVYRFRRGDNCIPVAVGGDLGTSALQSNVINVTPFFSTTDIRVIGIGMNITTSASGRCRLGIYADSGTIYPGRLLLDSGEFNTTPSGAKSVGVDLTLYANRLYWIGYTANAAPTAQNFSNLYGSILGTSAMSAQNNTNYSVTYTYNTLPAIFPANASEIASHSVVRLVGKISPYVRTRPYTEDVGCYSFRKAGRYFNSYIQSRSMTTTTFSANLIYFYQFISEKVEVFDQIGFNNNTTNASGLARLGIYTDNKYASPRRLILDAGEVSLASTGARVININCTLVPGLYWTAIIFNTGSTLTAESFGGLENLCTGVTTETTSAVTRKRVSYTYNVLPNPAPTTEFDTSGAYPSVVYLRKLK